MLFRETVALYCDNHTEHKYNNKFKIYKVLTEHIQNTYTILYVRMSSLWSWAAIISALSSLLARDVSTRHASPARQRRLHETRRAYPRQFSSFTPASWPSRDTQGIHSAVIWVQDIFTLHLQLRVYVQFRQSKNSHGQWG
jgi:hypothetical protein